MKEVSVLVILDVPEQATSQELESYIEGLFEGKLVKLQHVLIPQEIEVLRGPRSEEIPATQEFVYCSHPNCGLPVQIDEDGVAAHCPDGHPFLDFKPLRLG